MNHLTYSRDSRPAGAPAAAAPRGMRTLTWALLTAALTVGPLLLYIAVGPADGNPIGLGLLAMVGVPVSGVLLLVAVVHLAVDAATAAGSRSR